MLCYSLVGRHVRKSTVAAANAEHAVGEGADAPLLQLLLAFHEDHGQTGLQMPVNVAVEDPHARVISGEAQHEVTGVQAAVVAVGGARRDSVNVARHRVEQFERRQLVVADLLDRCHTAAHDPRGVRVHVERVLLVLHVDQYNLNVLAKLNLARVGVDRQLLGL